MELLHTNDNLYLYIRTALRPINQLFRLASQGCNLKGLSDAEGQARENASSATSKRQF